MGSLSEVGSLSGSLEGEVLVDLGLLLDVGRRDLVVLVVLAPHIARQSSISCDAESETHHSDEVLEDGVGLPDGKVTVLVVNERGDTTVGVERDVGGGLLLLLVELEVDGSVGESESCVDATSSERFVGGQKKVLLTSEDEDDLPS